MQIRPVSIPVDDLTLSGRMFQPEFTQPLPGLIVLHEWHPYDTNVIETVSDISKSLANAGYVVLALAMRGWPDTGGEDDCGEKQPQDVAIALNWLSQQAGVKATALGILGFSRGGSIALLTAAYAKQVRAIIAVYPVTDVERWAETTNLMPIPTWYLPEICAKGIGAKAKSPLYLADQIDAATLLIHGDQDKSVSFEQSERMAKVMKQHNKQVTLQVLEGAEHGGFNAEHERLLKESISQFLHLAFAD